MNPGKQHAGNIKVIEIGIPRGAPGASRAGLSSRSACSTCPRAPDAERLEVRIPASWSIDRRLRGADGCTDNGHADRLRAQGAGYVQVAVQRPVQQMRWTCACSSRQMSRGLPDDDGLFPPSRPAWPTWRRSPAETRPGAVVLGPGIGRAEAYPVAQQDGAGPMKSPPAVIADGLDAHAAQLDLFRGHEAPTTCSRRTRPTRPPPRDRN